MHQFEEHHPELKGFSEYYHREIFPILAVGDGARRQALRKTAIFGGLIAILTIFGAVYLARLKGEAQPSIITAFIGFGAIAALYSRLIKGVRGETKEKIVGSICSYIGWQFKAEVTEKPDLDYWSDLGLLPKGHKDGNVFGGKRSSFEDQIWGEAHGAQFNSVEVHLERKGDKSWHTVLRGQMMTLTFPRKFLGRTVVLRDKGFLQGKKKGDMKRVGLVDPVFEKIFEAYSTDQVESRYLLDPVFMQKLIELERSVDGKNIRFGFVDEQLLIVVETPNRFEAGSMLRPLTMPDRTQKILDEIGAIYDIVDGLMKPGHSNQS